MNRSTDDGEVPTAPPDSGDASSYENDNDYVAMPAWVRRMYGSPSSQRPLGQAATQQSAQPPLQRNSHAPLQWTHQVPVANDLARDHERINYDIESAETFRRMHLEDQRAHQTPRGSPERYAYASKCNDTVVSPGLDSEPDRTFSPLSAFSTSPLRSKGISEGTGRKNDCYHANGALGQEGKEDIDPSSLQEAPVKTPLINKEEKEIGDAEGYVASDRVSDIVDAGKNIETGGIPLSKAAALHARRRLQLRTCNKDPYGVPLPNTSRPFSIFASPKSIAEVCTGLGVYLASLKSAILLACLLSVCAIYPIVDNLHTQRWADNYNLFVQNPDIGSSVATCPKGWELSSWITQFTIGGHCSGVSHTSIYDCASQCIWDPNVLSHSQCRGVPPLGTNLNTSAAVMSSENKNVQASNMDQYSNELSGKCAQHLPCNEGQTNPFAADGPCYCCTMHLDEVTLENNSRVSSGQLWTLFVCQLVFMAWILLLMHTQVKTAMVQGSRVIGPSDFSIWLTGIPKSRAEDGPLSHWCGQFGPIVAAFNVPSVGDALRVGRRVHNLEIKKAEAMALEGSSSWNPIRWIYRKFVVGNIISIDNTLEKQKLKLAIYERQESEATGQGLATFEYSESAAECIAEFDTPLLGKILNLVTFGLANKTPKLHGANIKVIRAPEPSDILWEHTNCTGRQAFFRRSWSWAFTGAIMLTGAGIQYGLAVLGQKTREDRIHAEYAAGAGALWALKEADEQTLRLRLVVVLTGTVVVTINLTIMLTMRALSWYERWSTRTSMQRWVMLKLSVSQLLNAFAAPVLAAYASKSKSGWYARGGLMEAAFFIQIANAFGPPLFHLLGIGDFVKYYLLSPFARTQPMLENLLAPPMFPLAEQHAASVTTLGLAMWFMPVLPISPLIAVTGLGFSYCANKYIALRRAAAPPNLSGMVTSILNWLLRLLPLIQLILMKYLYYSDYHAMTPVFYTGLSFWLLFCIAPIRALLGTVRRRRKPSAASGISYNRLLGGRRLGVGEVYAPLVPKTCSRHFKEHLAETFAQLAPSAFDSIINGEEVVARLFGDNKDTRRFVNSTSIEPSQPNPRTSLRASIAAGVHGTITLLWKPLDTDHPEDEFLTPKNHKNISSSYSPSAPPGALDFNSIIDIENGKSHHVTDSKIANDTPPLRQRYGNVANVQENQQPASALAPNVAPHAGIATVHHRNTPPHVITNPSPIPRPSARRGGMSRFALLEPTAFRPLGTGLNDIDKKI